MPMPRLFCPTLDKGIVIPPEEEAHHARNALRLGENDRLILFDGRGKEGIGRVVSTDRRGFSVEVEAVTTHDFDVPVRLTIAVAMPKTHRQGYLIEKCTELGAAAIWPMITARTVAKPGLGVVPKWQRRVIEAAKQSGRRWIPDILPPQPFDTVLSRCAAFDQAIMADAGDQSQPVHQWLGEVSRGHKILALVGPEGGWTDEEREAAASAGLSFVRLIGTTLRTETAAIALTVLANSLATDS